MYCKKIVILFILLVTLSVVIITNITKESHSDTLRLVHIIFRHGERSPSKSYTNDPYKNYTWPGGWDQLSTAGKLEEYILGERLRTHYNWFLSEEYHDKDILIESSYADRCIMSAQLVLAGMYKPVNLQIWNPELLWQPIPVHSIPRFIDNKIAIKQACPSYEKALKDAYNTQKMQTINAENEEIYNYLTKHSGDSIQNVRSLETLYNTLEIESKNNLKLPDWTGKYFVEMKKLALLSLELFTDTEFMKRMHGGVLAREIINQMQEKAEGKLNPDRKMFLYSGHDLTIVTILRVLGFDDLLKPDFGAAVIIELHKVENLHNVKFFYKPTPNADLKELTLNNCIPCTLETLAERLKNVLPTDWDKECLN